MGPTGSEGVYTVDLVICVRARVVAAMFVLSGPNASLWCGIESKHVVVFPRTVALQSASRGIKGNVRMSSDSATCEVEAVRLRYGALWSLLVCRGLLEVHGGLLGSTECRGRL